MRQSSRSWEICILAGGLSQRMGQDKSRLRLGGRSVLGLIRSEAQKLQMPVRVIRKDAVPRCGPLGGVLTALLSSRAEATIFLSCDAPFITANLLRYLKRAFGRDDTALFLAAEKRAGFPFIVRKCALPVVQRQIEVQEFSLQNLARVLRAKKIPTAPDWREQLQNINTPADWAAAKIRWREGRMRR